MVRSKKEFSQKIESLYNCCTTCYSGLTQWLLGEKNSMPFYIPIVWREPTNNVPNCFFCMTKIAGFTKKNKSAIMYPNCSTDK